MYPELVDYRNGLCEIGVLTKYIRPLIVLCLLSAAIIPLRPASADIYMYIDKDGVIHFTNTPTVSDTDYRLYVKELPKALATYYSPDRYDRMINQASQKFGVAAPLLKAIIKAESDFDRYAVSKKGARGLMQIMPENYKSLNISNPFDPWENIMGGAKYFRRMLDRFDGKLALSLAAYNAGPTAVERYQNIPPYKETETYVERVLHYYYSYKY